MYIYPPKKIFSHLTSIQVVSLLESSGQFDVKIEKHGFVVKEKKKFSNNLLIPLVNSIFDKQGDNIIIKIMFELQNKDKLGLGIFTLSIFLLSLLFGVASSDIILAMTLICFDFVLCSIFWLLYAYNCNRAFKKIVRCLKASSEKKS